MMRFSRVLCFVVSCLLFAVFVVVVCCVLFDCVLLDVGCVLFVACFLLFEV